MNSSKLQSGDQGVISYKSSNPFEFFHILNSKKAKDFSKIAKSNDFSTVLLNDSLFK